jgi:hypothetical protein
VNRQDILIMINPTDSDGPVVHVACGCPKEGETFEKIGLHTAVLILKSGGRLCVRS